MGSEEGLVVPLLPRQPHRFAQETQPLSPSQCQAGLSPTQPKSEGLYVLKRGPWEGE